MTSKERCLAALSGKAVDRVPVFPLLMFFAQKRFGVTYRQFATNGHVLAEAQLKALASFPIDAITACSDAFRIPADLGGEMAFPDNKPPHLVKHMVGSAGDLGKLSRPGPTARGSRMADRVLSVGEMVRAAGDQCLVLGWVEMPFAEACNICGMAEFMMMMYDDPALAHKVLEFLTGLEIDFAVAQIRAGAPMVGAGDAAASLIPPELYRQFVLPYERRVCAGVHDAGGMVKLHVCGNTAHLLADMAACGADLFNVDHMVDFRAARDTYTQAGLAFKGNLDPVEDMLRATPEYCRRRSMECLQVAKGTRFMLSPGCEVPAETPDEVFMEFCQAPKT
jgi:MtaA/CmuA family methyltransferase